MAAQVVAKHLASHFVYTRQQYGAAGPFLGH